MQIYILCSRNENSSSAHNTNLQQLPMLVSTLESLLATTQHLSMELYALVVFHFFATAAIDPVNILAAKYA